MVMPVAGLMMGIALRARVAAGWCSFSEDCVCWKLGGTKDGDVELSENDVATDVGCCVGELCGELLAKDERSDPLFIETN